MSMTSSSRRSGTVLLFALAVAVAPAHAQDAEAPSAVTAPCTADLENPGIMKDIVSNALMLGLERPEGDVAAFLRNAESDYATGEDLLRAAARRFAIDEAVLTAEVERFRHCNCSHGPVAAGAQAEEPAPAPSGSGDAAAEVSDFARDVTLHVVLHELGHALIREFDLPVLGNEEVMADAFATHYLTTWLPDRAVAVLTARTTSLMIEAGEVPREQWTVHGEHENDARRAFQIAALAIAADPAKYGAVATVVGMSERDVRRARDYGAEIHRSWRRVLAPLWMPGGARSNEVRVVGDSAVFERLRGGGLVGELDAALRRFDWHSQVTVRFAAGAGGAGWSRSGRTITVHDEYVRRFTEQGRAAGF